MINEIKALHFEDTCYVLKTAQAGFKEINRHANDLYIMDIFHVLDMQCALFVSHLAPCFAAGIHRVMPLVFHKNFSCFITALT